jgi:aminomuconate-semialdehyde/2-hydroxymuconate-6-semialdehyde dehydrogenase
MEKLQNFINGTYVPPKNGQYIDNFEPATGQVYALIPDSDEEDVVDAVEAAEKAFPIWSNMSIEERSQILVRLSEGIEKNMDEFVQAESRDNGKPVSLAAHVDIPRAVSNFHFFATAITHFASESHHMEGVGINFTTRKPHWNCWMYFPLELATLLVFMENCSGFSSGQLRHCKAV